jgi:predicted MFS family arabinose efflux permease
VGGAGGWAQNAFAALKVPAFRRFLLGHAVSVHAFWMRIAAQAWLVFELTGSEAALGGVTAAGLLPTVVISPLAGALADRYDKRRLLMGVAIGTLLANLALAAVIFAGEVHVSHVVATAVAVGCFRAVEMPVRQAFVVEVVGHDTLPNAIALVASTFNLARVLGPALAGFLLAGAGTGTCYAVIGLLSGATAVTLALLPRRKHAQPPAPHGTWAQMRKGFAYVAAHRHVRLLVLLMGSSMVFAWTYTGMLAALAQDAYGLQERGYGALMGVSGVGALAGALWVSGRAAHGPAETAMLVRCVGLGALAVAGLALAPNAWLAGIALAVAAFCQVAFMSSSNTQIQREVPDALRGAVMGLWVFTFGATAPLGALLVGLAAQRVGLRTALLAGALAMVALTFAIGLRLIASRAPSVAHRAPQPEVPPSEV